MKHFRILAFLGVLVFSLTAHAKNNPLALIEEDTHSGFSMYRSGQPTDKMLPKICKAGIQAVFALNGKANQYAGDLQKLCPGLHIVYNVEQDADSGIDHQFLEEFDAQVARAQAQGYGILFHCNCGCHRTGRLAAYYRMKYDHWSLKDALKEMDKVGQHMSEHPSLEAQVTAMQDYIRGEKCSQKKKYCVQ